MQINEFAYLRRQANNDRWQHSYLNLKHRRMLFPDKPSGAGRQLLEFLDSQSEFDKSMAAVLDIGCGNGRNAFALSREGFGQVIGFDIIPQAIQDATQHAEDSGLQNVMFTIHNIENPWPFDNATFNVAIDVNTFSSLLSDVRTTYISELVRVLDVGGYFFLTTYTLQDGYYKSFVAHDSERLYPGIGIVCPDDGIARVLYTPEELKEIFVTVSEGQLFVMDTNVHTWYGKMFDRYYKREFCSFVFEKHE